MGRRSRICGSTSVSTACSRKRSLMHSLHPVVMSVSSKVLDKAAGCPPTAIINQVGFRIGKQIGKPLKEHTRVSMRSPRA
jgi:hypothetical protein